MARKATADDFFRCEACEKDFGIEEGGYYPKSAVIEHNPSAFGTPFGPKGERYYTCPRGHRVTIDAKSGT